MNLEIREFEDSFTNGVIDLILPIQQKEFKIEISLEDQPDLNEIKSFYQKKRGNFWVATLDGNVVGTIALIDIGNRQCALRKMFVKKEHRGKDKEIAKKLVMRMFEWCNDMDVKSVFLGTTSKYHAAHRFYEKNGFEEIRKEDLPDNFPVMEVDSKFYTFNLDK